VNRTAVRQAIIYWSKVMDSGVTEFYDPDYNHTGSIRDLVFELKSALANDRRMTKAL
jgi:hypothetical protein